MYGEAMFVSLRGAQIWLPEANKIMRHRVCDKKPVFVFINIVYVIESAAYGVICTSCLCQNPNERGTSE